MSTHHTLLPVPGTVHRGTFDAAVPPALTVASGDTIEITSLSGDADDLPLSSSGFTVSAAHRDVLERVSSGLGPHFMTGPVAVKGAMPGDELIVDVLKVDLANDWGWNVTRAGKGTLPDLFPDGRRIHIGIDREKRIVKLPWGLELPAAPFFGIIGVAPSPADGPVTSIIPRAWGGNIDCKHLGAGARLHLPVFNEGALLSAGDGHALQGDGEVCLTAVETGLRGTLRLTVARDTGIAGPWAETPTHIITMAFDPYLDIAAQNAVRAMVRMIERLGGLAAADAYTLCSIAADVHVTQLVNVSKGVHVMLAKSALGLR